MSDAEFNQIRRDGTALGAVFKDNAIFNDVNGTGELVLTATFGRTGFDDFSAQANAVIFGNRNTAGLAQRLPAVETAAEIGFNIASAIISLGTTLGPVGGATLGLGAQAVGGTAVKVTPQSASAISNAITGFTKHGINQAISKNGVGVSSKAMLEAVKNPIKVVNQADGTIRYIGKNAVVILNKAGEVVTTWAKNIMGRRIGP